MLHTTGTYILLYETYTSNTQLTRNLFNELYRRYKQHNAQHSRYLYQNKKYNI